MARKGFRRCQRCNLNRQDKFFKPRGRVCSACQKGRTRAASRSARLVETYGITHAQYERMVEQQGGRCAICRGQRKGNYDVDHSHKTGQVRGALCRRCNRRLLPACLDNPLILQAAIDYLTNPPAEEVIGVVVVPDHKGVTVTVPALTHQ